MRSTMSASKGRIYRHDQPCQAEESCTVVIADSNAVIADSNAVIAEHVTQISCPKGIFGKQCAWSLLTMHMGLQARAP